MPNDSFRILLVDDSAVARRILRDAISTDPQLEVAGTAQNGRLALEAIKKLKPDLVVLDLEMPEMDGLTALAELRKTNRRLPVIMFSNSTQRGAMATLDALALGADDYVPKERNMASPLAAIEDLRRDFLPKIHALCARNKYEKSKSAQELVPPAPALQRLLEREIEIVVIGVSTGGPEALLKLLPEIPQDLPVPLVAVQHMPPIFTKILAERLSLKCSMPVREAMGGERLAPGVIWLAPGGQHLRLASDSEGVLLQLDTSPPRNYCRPSVDVLFESADKIYGPGTLAVVLTGMGADGLKSCEGIRRSGGQIIVQDEETSVVWGMPGAVARAGLADAIKPLPQLADEVIRRVTQHRGTRPHLRAANVSTRSLYVQPGK